MAETNDELLNHEYDGIREFDNPTPAWWNWLFFLSFVFSILYFFHFHLGHGQGVVASYETEMKTFRAAQEQRALAEAKLISEEKIATRMADTQNVSAGATKYAEYCANCHNKAGEGLIGPNLTDNFWLHGDGTLMAIRKVVVEGVAAKGMPGWGKVLSTEDLLNVVAYVGSIRGTNVRGKAPQGQRMPESQGI
ncbi:MAG: cbb3-type cytochrome c oxidase N-terminal domain-containing protein [Myxococcota bacterium]